MFVNFIFSFLILFCIFERYFYSILMSPYFTYILRCADDTLYTGITTDLERRVQEHDSDDTK